MKQGLKFVENITTNNKATNKQLEINYKNNLLQNKST